MNVRRTRTRALAALALAMWRHLRPSPAMLVACTALFVALGGSAYAVATGSIGTRAIADNSVRSGDVRNNALLGRDLRDGAIDSRDVANFSLLAHDFAPGQLPSGRQGAPGLPGPRGPRGFTGAPGPFSDVLPSGGTVVGAYSLTATNEDTSSGDVLTDAISFGFRLASAPTVNVLPPGSSPTTNCPGSVASPDAAPGFLCIYEAQSTNASALGVVAPGGAQDQTAGVSGARIAVASATTSDNTNIIVHGSWAVTAP